MASLLLFIILITSLFGLTFVTKRRFGVLGLALAAGYLVSTHWASTLTPFIEQQGVVLAVPPLSLVVQAALILLPSMILLIGGPVYDKPWPRFLGSLAFSLLAFTFLLPALGSATTMSDPGLGVYVFFSNFQSLIIVTGLTLATLDVFLTRRPKSGKSH